MPSEITVTVKDHEKNLKAKHLVYDDFKMNQDDPAIRACIAETIKTFGSTPEVVRVSAKFEVV